MRFSIPRIPRSKPVNFWRAPLWKWLVFAALLVVSAMLLGWEQHIVSPPPVKVEFLPTQYPAPTWDGSYPASTGLFTLRKIDIFVPDVMPLVLTRTYRPWEGPIQRSNDPFLLARSVDSSQTPYLFLSCGEQEGLLPANRQFAVLLSQRHIGHEFHTIHGGHDWNQWNAWLPTCFESLLQHFHPAS
jgi:hypothetical protein